MAQSVIQTSFAAGELSPNLFARVDLEKYTTGALLMRNFFVDYRGGASTRPGTIFKAQVGVNSTVRLIPFVVAQIAAYVLEFGDHYIRFITGGSYITGAPTAITGVTQAAPAVVTDVAHGYATGDEVFISGVVGMTELNGKNFKIVVLSANTYSLKDLQGVAIDSRGYSAYISGGTAARIYQIVSPYASTDLKNLKFVQSADVLSITLAGTVPYDLTRIGVNTFAISAIVTGATILAPTGLAVTPVSAGNYHYGYTVTSVNATGQEESLEPAAVVGTSVIINQLTGEVVRLHWNSATGAASYNIYKWGPIPIALPNASIGGFIGQSVSQDFVDNNIAPDFSQTAPRAYDPFSGGTSYPGCVTYFQQRRVYGALTLNPESMIMSETGNYLNFNKSLIPKGSDSINISLASREVNTIQYLVAMSSGLVAFTTGGVFLVSGGGAAFAAVTPENVTAQPQASPGCHDNVPPIVVNDRILFVQAKGSTVRDTVYNFYTNSYVATDRSQLASQLFFGKQILEWAFAEEPFRLCWAIRDDGIMLCMTFVPEQEVYGWTRHDTEGVFESICTIPEGDEDAVYVVVRRTIIGADRRYVERLASRKFTSSLDAWFVDCGLQYNGAPATVISGLDHLVGKTVQIVADGQVLPNQVVSATGTITLPNAASIVTVGLQFLPQLQTLRLDTGEPTIQGRRKLIPAATLRVDSTRGLKAGIDFTYMDEIPELQVAYTPPIELITGDLYLPLPTDWTTGGYICIQQDYPLPATVLGIIPEVLLGDTQR